MLLVGLLCFWWVLKKNKIIIIIAIIRCSKRQMSLKLNAALHLPAQAPRCPIKKCLVSLRGAQCTFRTKCTKRPTKSEKDPPKAQKTHQKHKDPPKPKRVFSGPTKSTSVFEGTHQKHIGPTKTETIFRGPTKTEMFFKRPTKSKTVPTFFS